MAKAKTLVGLDVHATKIVAAVLDADTGELKTFAMSGDTAAVAGFCAGLPRPVRVAYEAGPTGYGLARELARRGVAAVAQFHNSAQARRRLPLAPGNATVSRASNGSSQAAGSSPNEQSVAALRTART